MPNVQGCILFLTDWEHIFRVLFLLNHPLQSLLYEEFNKASTMRSCIQHWLNNSQHTSLFFPFLLLIRQGNNFGWWHALYIRKGWSFLVLCLNKFSPWQRQRGQSQYWNCPATSTRLITASDLPAHQVSAPAYL